MATSTIYLYGDQKNASGTIIKNFPLQLGKNWVIDDIEEMLGDYLLGTLQNVQYQRTSLFKTLDLDFSQSIIANGLNDLSFIRYVGIKNSDEVSTCYYFAKPYQQRAKKTVRFELVMDTLNSCLGSAAKQRQLTFSDRTAIAREHVDRFYNVKSGSDYIRKIPLMPEGINPQLFKSKSILLDSLQAGEVGKNNWYLIYRTAIKPGETDLTKIGNPIKCYLLNDLPIKYRASSAEREYTLTAEEFYANAGGNNTLGFTKEKGNEGTIEVAGKTLDMSAYDYCFLYQWNRSLSTWLLVAGNIDRPTAQTLIADNLDGTSDVVFKGTWTQGSFLNTTYNKTAIKWLDPSNAFEAIYNIESSLKIYNISLFSDGYTIAFKDLDRTDSRLVKIICLPYCPFPYAIGGNGVLTPTGGWQAPRDYQFTEHMLEIVDLNKTLKVDLSMTVSNDAATFLELKQFISSNDVFYETPRYLEESKIYHSEFYQRKFYYDSFSYSIDLEKMVVNASDWLSVDKTKTYLSFQMTNGIKSAMIFSIPTLESVAHYASNDYDGIFYVNRNNEVATFDNSYIDYLRTGYNFDVKAKNRNVAMSVLGMLTGGASSLLGLGRNLAIKEENTKERERISTTSIRLSAAGTALSIASNIANGISNIITQEENFRKNLQQRALQATAVENADDLDLLKAYTGNKVSVATWEPLPEVKKYLNDLFYYTGSKVGYMGVPNVNTRLYFNFLQCNPIFTATYTWNEDVINDVTQKLQEGVTYFHHPYDVYDFEQKYENFEIWLFNN